MNTAMSNEKRLHQAIDRLDRHSDHDDNNGGTNGL